MDKNVTSTSRRKWSELTIRDKKFTYILVVDYGVVRSTRKYSKARTSAVERGVIDNRIMLQDMASKAKSNFKTSMEDKKRSMGGNSDKKKRKREDKKEENIGNSSVPKRKKLSKKVDNQVEEGRRSSSSSSMDKNMRGDKIKWEPRITVEGFQGDSSVGKQGGRGGSTARITGYFESLLEHQTRPGVSTAVRCTVSKGELTNGRDFAITSGLVTAKPWFETTLHGLDQQPMGEGKTSEPRDRDA